MRILFALVAAAILLGGTLAVAQDGTALYQKNCASCHGADGMANTPAAKAMKVPALAPMHLSPDDIVAKLKASEKHKNVLKKLSDAELTAIASAVPKPPS